MSPLPEDVQLPSGWVCKRACEDALVLGYETGGVEVEATRLDDAEALPPDLTSGWELTCRKRVGESVSERAIGRVTTRAAATDALRSCMERVCTLARTTGSTDGLTPSSIAEGVELRGEIPSTTPDPDSRDGGCRMGLSH